VSEVSGDDPREEIESEGFQGLVRSIGEIGEHMRALHQKAEVAYTPIVEAILRGRSGDIAHIERTLDGLLGFCGDARVLLLYRRLCRHLWELDQAAAVAYVNLYREMYDPTEEGEWRAQRLTGLRPGQ
jgi:hypothetical protein